MSINIKIGADVSSVDAAIDNVSKSLNGLKAPVANANYALNSLSQVTRDLPFGFIAIQNNLPLVVDSFGQLSREAGGTVPALKALASSLIGPAGISLAFSAVTSIITVAVQKYGSLGNAIDALFSKNSKLAESQNLYNKELAEAQGNTQAEATKIDILVRNLNNLQKPLADRYAAYVELRKISPDIVAGIKDENALTQASIGIINANAQARKQLILLKAKESAISAVINKNANEQFSLEIQIRKNVENLLIAQKKYNDTKKVTNTQALAAQQGISAESITLQKAEKEYIKSVNAYNQLAEVQRTYSDQLDPIISQIANIDGNTKSLNDSTKELKNTTKDFKYILPEYEGSSAAKNQIQDIANLADVILDLNKKYGERKDALAKLQTEGDGFFKNISLEKTSYENIKDAIDTYIHQLQVSEANIKARTSAQKLQQQADLNSARALEELSKAQQDAFDSITKLSLANDIKPKINIDYSQLGFNKKIVEGLNKGLNIEDATKNLVSTFKQTYDSISGVFFSPIQDLFSNFIQTGKFAFKDFAKAVLQAISQVVAKVIATGIITLLASIFTGGLGATGAVGKAGGFGKILLGALGFGGVANPSFGGVNAGGMQMAGSVNMVLRGQDLIGSINRTNSQLSRIG